MSYQFTIDGKIDCWLLNNKNWNRIFLALNNFRHYRGWHLDSKEWGALVYCIRGDFLSNNLVKHKVQPTSEYLTNWLINCFDFEDLTLTELDKKRLKVK